MTNNLNGRSVVSMGSYEETLSAAYGSRLEALASTFPPISIRNMCGHMVFGSQKGGGASLLAATPHSNGGGSTATDYRNPPRRRFSLRPVSALSRLDQRRLRRCHQHGYTGGYQVLSVNTKGNSSTPSVGRSTTPRQAARTMAKCCVIRTTLQPFKHDGRSLSCDQMAPAT
jgi:hypothetical protein